MKNLVLALTCLTIIPCSIAACAANDRHVQTAVVQQRATFDLNCPSLEVQHLSGDLFTVVGCGHRAVYNANGRCSERDNCEAVREPDGTTSEK